MWQWLLGWAVPATATASKPRSETRPQLEPLEERALLAVNPFLEINGRNLLAFNRDDAAILRLQNRREFLPNEAPTVRRAIPNVNVAKNAADTVIDLRNHFRDLDVGNTRIRINTSRGSMDVKLFDQDAPITVKNYLKYIADGKYTDSIFHRSVTNFVIQAGGFNFKTNPNRLDPVATDPAIKNEPGRSNVRGTLAMAKTPGDPNSATSQFFINLSNTNAASLDTQNGGFTVFGQVTGRGMSVADNIAQVPKQNRGDPFSEIPLLNYNPSVPDFPADTTRANYVIINSISVLERADMMTFSVVSNSNTNLVDVRVEGNKLTLDYKPDQTGTATIVVRATDTFNRSVQTSFTVTVS